MFLCIWLNLPFDAAMGFLSKMINSNEFRSCDMITLNRKSNSHTMVNISNTRIVHEWIKEGEEKKRKCLKIQEKEQEGATDGVCLSIFSRTAAVDLGLGQNRPVLCLRHDKEGIIATFQVQQMPLGLQ